MKAIHRKQRSLVDRRSKTDKTQPAVLQLPKKGTDLFRFHFDIIATFALVPFLKKHFALIPLSQSFGPG